MRSATDGRRRAAGVVEVLVSALVLLLWSALAHDLDQATSANATACAAPLVQAGPSLAPNATACPPDAASGPVRPIPSGAGVAQAR